MAKKVVVPDNLAPVDFDINSTDKLIYVKGKGSVITFGIGVPIDIPENPNTVYYDTDTGSIYEWDSDEWVIKILGNLNQV